MSKEKRFIYSTIGDPFSSKTYSGVPFELFREMNHHVDEVCRINGKIFKITDIFTGFYDLKGSFARRRPYRNALWRYRTGSFRKLSERITNRLYDKKYDVFFQIGCGGLPDDDSFKVAHIEIPLHQCISDRSYAKSYGFDRLKNTEIVDALEGEKKFLETVDLIWTNTNWTASLLREINVPEEKIFVYPPCVAYRDIAYIPKTMKQPKILFIGKDWKRKGGDRLYEAFLKLNADFPDAELHIVGCDPKLKSRRNITIHGFLDKSIASDLQTFNELIETSNIFCMPSVWESTGIVYFEALQRSLPVLMVTGQGREDLFKGMAHIIPDNSTESVYQGLLSMIENYERSQSECYYGFQMVECKYNYSSLIKALLSRIDSSLMLSL